MNPTTLWAYTGAWTLLALTPGPAVLFVMTHAGRHGARAAGGAGLGILSGHVVFFTAIGMGLVALLQSATAAFETLRLLGALYLGYLGWRMLWPKRAEGAKEAPAGRENRGENHGGAATILKGLAIQVTNPKALVFMASFLPQFIDKTSPALPQLVVLFLVTVIIDAAVLAGYAAIAWRGRSVMQGNVVFRWVERVLGAAMLGFACRLCVDRK